VAACLEQGFALKSQVNGQWVYALNPSNWEHFMALPQPKKSILKRIGLACGFLLLVAALASIAALDSNGNGGGLP
jgi:hypothetical protein